MLCCVTLTVLHCATGMMQPTLRKRMSARDLRMSTTELKPPTLDEKTLARTGSWFCVLSKAGYVGNALPIPVEVAGEKLVAWKSPITSEWSVMRDECPHRLAPLSQGRVDPQTGCIECPYHGQQFDVTGACTKIPQSPASSYPSSTAAFALPVYSTGDLLWAYVPLPPGQASYYPGLPDQIMPELSEAPAFMVRDLPYSFDFFMENFMDPSHVPFAHHSLQGSRDDGSPIPMQVLTSYDNATMLEVGYQDEISGRKRDGVVSFTAPFYYHFRTKNFKTNVTSKNLIAVVMPVSAGKCRVFFELPPVRKLRKKFPDWVLHYFSNNFLDSDVWVHDQERFQRSGKNIFEPQEPICDEAGAKSVTGDRYVMTTQSDTGTIAWRKWWKMHMSQSPLFGDPKVAVPWMTRDEQLDRYEGHARHCLSCQGAEKKAQKVKKFAPFLAVLLAAIAPNRVLKVLGLAVAVIVNEIAERVIRAILGPKNGDITSAAQFPETKKDRKRSADRKKRLALKPV